MDGRFPALAHALERLHGRLEIIIALGHGGEGKFRDVQNHRGRIGLQFPLQVPVSGESGSGKKDCGQQQGHDLHGATFGAVGCNRSDEVPERGAPAMRSSRARLMP